MSDAPDSFPAGDDGRPNQTLGGRIRRRALKFVEARTAGTLAAVRRAPGRLRADGFFALRKLAEADPSRLLRLVRRTRRIARGSDFLVGAEAILTARAHGWPAAAPLFERLGTAKNPAAAAGLLRLRPAPALRLALPRPDRPTQVPAEEAAETVIYTAVYGAAPPPRAIFYEVPGLRLLCLTDRPDLTVAGWETVPLAPPVNDPALAAAWCRILPHRALAEAAPAARASLFLAPDRWLVGNVHTLLTRWCHAQEVVLWRHDGAADWHDLAERHLLGSRRRSAEVLAQAGDCAERNLPREGGACDTGMIWRRHGRADVQALMERWWAECVKHPAGLESIALCASLHAADAPPLRPAILPAVLGPAADNAFVARLAAAPPSRAAAAPARIRARLPVAFVYAEEYATAASTFLRGKQLSDMVAERYPDRLEIAYTSDLEAVRDRVVVLTNGALRVASPDALAALRKRNIVVIGSWDHVRPDAVKVRETDANMTLAYRQTIDFARLFPDKPVHMVTHQVNRQIRPTTPPTDRLRIGYFGLPANTTRPESLGDLVDIVSISTLKVDMDWIDRLPRYNCHWMVRRYKPRDGWKPFLKGFVAARCGAVVIVGRDDEDAMQYLGDDYPFYVRTHDPDLLEYDTAVVAAAFGGPEWRKARAIMDQVAARSSDAQVCAEFRAMVDDLTR